VPGHEELAMGAIASGGIRVLNNGVIAPVEFLLLSLSVRSRRSEVERRAALS
jgi:putative phosphoribosyl transferase